MEQLKPYFGVGSTEHRGGADPTRAGADQHLGRSGFGAVTRRTRTMLPDADAVRARARAPLAVRASEPYASGGPRPNAQTPFFVFVLFTRFGKTPPRGRHLRCAHFAPDKIALASFSAFISATFAACLSQLLRRSPRVSWSSPNFSTVALRSALAMTRSSLACARPPCC